jgi:hypothetical protein
MPYFFLPFFFLPLFLAFLIFKPVYNHYQPDRAHVSGYTEKPLIAKSSDAGKFKSKIEANEIPAIEIKSQGQDGICFSPPSYHKHGHPYEAKKKIVPKTLSITQASKCMLTLDSELSVSII